MFLTLSHISRTFISCNNRQQYYYIFIGHFLNFIIRCSTAAHVTIYNKPRTWLRFKAVNEMVSQYSTALRIAGTWLLFSDRLYRSIIFLNKILNLPCLLQRIRLLVINRRKQTNKHLNFTCCFTGNMTLDFSQKKLIQ